MKLLLICLLLFISPFIKAPDWESQKMDLVKAISNYRASLIQDDFEQMALFALLIQKWNEAELPKEIQQNLLLNIPIAVKIYNYNFENIAFRLQGDYLDFEVIQEMTQKEINTIVDNSDLIDLITHGILKKDFPFAMSSHNNAYEELAFYDIQKNQTIGEIGAGNGTFSILLALLDKSLNLYINEIEQSALTYLKQKLERSNEHLDTNRINLILGQKNNTNFADSTIDKIIIRKSLHHFENRKLMLKSIKKALKKDGELYIYENLPRLNLERNMCSKLMSEKAIKNSLKKAGFVFEKELILDGVIIIKYVMEN